MLFFYIFVLSLFTIALQQKLTHWRQLVNLKFWFAWLTKLCEQNGPTKFW